jgi:two-component system OmpR family response regulator
MSTTAHVLIVDDDPTIRAVIAEYLCRYEFRVSAVAEGREMQAVLAQEVIDLVVLDLKLQRENGLSLAARLRERSTIPIIMLTGRHEEADRVMGLEVAADDYLTKPFSPRELLARIRAVLRRHSPGMRPSASAGVRAYRFDGRELNLNTRRLTTCDGRVVSLSSGEFDLLISLLRAPNRTLTREQLLDMSRLHDDEIDERSVKTRILRLRKKLGSDPDKPNCIRTERGAGYVLHARVETIY